MSLEDLLPMSSDHTPLFLFRDPFSYSPFPILTPFPIPLFLSLLFLPEHRPYCFFPAECSG